jgi:hypothetical protein
MNGWLPGAHAHGGIVGEPDEIEAAGEVRSLDEWPIANSQYAVAKQLEPGALQRLSDAFESLRGRGSVIVRYER